MTAEQAVVMAEELARIAAAGGGTKAFASHLARTAAVSVLVEDAEWKHLATAGDAPATSIRELVPQDAFHRDVLRFTNGRAGFVVPIALGEAHLGWLAIFGKSDAGLEFGARLVAAAIAVELARESGGHRGRQRTFWERLAARAYHDATTARDEAAARGVTLASHYVAVSFELEVADESTAPAQRADLRKIASDALRSNDADVGMFERAGEFIFLVPSTREIDASNVRTAATLLPRNAAKKASEMRFSGGVGTQQPLLSAWRSVEQATNALLIGRRIFGSGRVVPYEDLGIYPLLFEGAKVEELRAFARERLAPLRAYDEKHQTELERTLQLYFAVGENVKTAAAELNVHRHTVFYRLRQISEICKCKLEDPHDQLTLRMALAIDALNK